PFGRREVSGDRERRRGGRGARRAGERSEHGQHTSGKHALAHFHRPVLSWLTRDRGGARCPAGSLNGGVGKVLQPAPSSRIRVGADVSEGANYRIIAATSGFRDSTSC